MGDLPAARIPACQRYGHFPAAPGEEIAPEAVLSVGSHSHLKEVIVLPVLAFSDTKALETAFNADSRESGHDQCSVFSNIGFVRLASGPHPPAPSTRKMGTTIGLLQKLSLYPMLFATNFLSSSETSSISR